MPATLRIRLVFNEKTGGAYLLDLPSSSGDVAHIAEPGVEVDEYRNAHRLAHIEVRIDQYSNTNYILLGLIAEQVSRTPLAQLFQQRIFGPLRMTGCSLPAATDASIPVRTGTGTWSGRAGG